MSRIDQLLYTLRWSLVILTGLMMLALIWWVFPPELGGAAGLLGVIGFLAVGPTAYVIYYLLALNYVAVLLITLRQLFPQGSLIGLRLAHDMPPQRRAVLTTSLMAAALCTGFVITGFESQNLWSTLIFNAEFTTLETHLFRAGPGMAVALFAWAIWITVLGRFWRAGNRYEQISIALTRLALTAMLLVIFAALVHGTGIKRHPELQHQALGSYTGLVLGMTVLIWICNVWAIRLFFLPAYHKAVELKQSLADDKRKHGHMSNTFRFIYFMRRLVFVGTALAMGAILWALVTDILIRVPVGSIALKHLEVWTGYWLIPDHGIRGILGFYPATRIAHLGMSVFGLSLFLISQILFELPLRNYLHSLTQKGRLSWLNAIGLAVPLAGLSVGAASLILEYMGMWGQYTIDAGSASSRRYFGIIFQPTFWIALPVLIGSYIFWLTMLRTIKLPGTMFFQRTQILYAIFVTATIELFIAGMIQSVSYGYGGAFYDKGTFTSICTSGAVTLWVLLPALRLTYAGQEYMAITSPIHDPAIPADLLSTAVQSAAESPSAVQGK